MSNVNNKRASKRAKIKVIIEEVINEYQTKSNEYIELNNTFLQLDIFLL